MTSFFIPVTSGSRRVNSGLVPVMHAAVPNVSAPNAPEVTIADSHPSREAIRRPTASWRSSSRTKRLDIAAIASTTSGAINDAVIIVYVPAPVMMGRTPSSCKKSRGVLIRLPLAVDGVEGPGRVSKSQLPHVAAGAPGCKDGATVADHNAEDDCCGSL